MYFIKSMNGLSVPTSQELAPRVRKVEVGSAHMITRE